jgi:hypothetical protein
MSVPQEPTKSTNPGVHQKWIEAGGFEGLSDKEKEQLERAQSFRNEGSGYFAIHSTRPMALAYGEWS